MPTILERIRARKFSSAASTAIDIGVNNEAQARLAIDAGGKLTWGSGASTGDVNLYRSAANTLKTDDSLVVASLFIGADEITTLSGVLNLDGGVENIRVLEADINLGEIEATIDGGTV